MVFREEVMVFRGTHRRSKFRMRPLSGYNALPIENPAVKIGARIELISQQIQGASL